MNKQLKKCLKCKYFDDKSDFPNQWCDKVLDIINCKGFVCPLKAEEDKKQTEKGKQGL